MLPRSFADEPDLNGPLIQHLSRHRFTEKSGNLATTRPEFKGNSPGSSERRRVIPSRETTNLHFRKSFDFSEIHAAAAQLLSFDAQSTSSSRTVAARAGAANPPSSLYAAIPAR
jgi:hypothetical protein